MEFEEQLLNFVIWVIASWVSEGRLDEFKSHNDP